jgi:hypothetical protein
MSTVPEYSFAVDEDLYHIAVASDVLTSSVIETIANIIEISPDHITLSAGGATIPPDSVFSASAQVNDPVSVNISGGTDPSDGGLFDEDEFSPADIDERITKLMSLSEGSVWTREQCEHALRVAYFNLDRAAELLFLGEIPETPALALSKLNGETPDAEAIHKQNIMKLWAETKIDVPLLVQYYEACGKDYEQTLQCIKS